MHDSANFCSVCGKSIDNPLESGIAVQKSMHQAVTINQQEYVDTLSEYLRDVMYCESSLIGFDSAIQEIRMVMGTLCVPRSLDAFPEKPIEPIYQAPSDTGRFIKAAIASILSFTGALAPIAIPYAIWQIIFGRNKDIAKAKEEYEEKKKVYNQVLFTYNEKIQEYRAIADEEEMRMSEETVQRQLYEEQLSMLNELSSQAKETLYVLYSFDIIHKKYQNFVAAASIYDYLSTGRTSSLARTSNDPGAYNIYEEDVRMNKIVSTIGMVGGQIINSVKSLDQSMRYQNQAICKAIDNASSIQSSYLAQINAGVDENNQSNAVRNQHLADIAKFQKIQTDAMRERDSLGLPMPVRDARGYFVDER